MIKFIVLLFMVKLFVSGSLRMSTMPAFKIYINIQYKEVTHIRKRSIYQIYPDFYTCRLVLKNLDAFVGYFCRNDVKNFQGALEMSKMRFTLR